LAFARYANTWPPDWVVEGPQKHEFLGRIVTLVRRLGTTGTSERRLFDEFKKRRVAFLASLSQDDWLVRETQLKTQWRLVSGLGIAHPFETGFVFDHTYGLPYLPGSSVKGVARAWARENEEEEGWDIDRRHVLFGPEEREDKVAGKRFEPAQGQVVFFDAYPVDWPKLEVDILNPHYGEYYRDANTPPADWLSPVPTYFLTLAANQALDFVVAVKPDSPHQQAVLKAANLTREEAAKKALEAVRGAATTLGLGGKTAVGYGYFE
jgi:CRISPR-associated protein Cmr6